jgi:hypothetical protein
VGMRDSPLESPQPLCPSQIADLRLAASQMTGPKRRAFQAEMALKYCGGNPLMAETLFGWGRRTVEVGLAERRTGIICLGAQSAFSGRKRWEDTHSEAAEALDRLAEAHAQQAPTFRTTLAYTYCISRRNFFDGKQLRLLYGSNRATRCAIIHGALGDTERARETSTTPPSAARSARCAHVGASLRPWTAAPEKLHRSGTLSRSRTPRWRTREKKRPHRLTIPRDALPTRPSSFRLLVMASPHWMLVGSH